MNVSSALNRVHRMLRVLRIWRLNFRREIRIAASAHLERTARIDLDSDGFAFGGTVIIGARSRIGHGVLISPYGGSIHVGEDVFIGPYCVLYGHGGLEIQSGAMIAAHSVLIPANHIFEDASKPIAKQGVKAEGIIVETDVWVGSGARILDGVTIRKGSVVGAGSVVTRSVPEYSVVMGVPARVVKRRSMGRTEEAVCSTSGAKSNCNQLK